MNPKNEFTSVIWLKTGDPELWRAIKLLLFTKISEKRQQHGTRARALEGDIVLLVSVTAVHLQLEHEGTTWTITIHCALVSSWTRALIYLIQDFMGKDGMSWDYDPQTSQRRESVRFVRGRILQGLIQFSDFNRQLFFLGWKKNKNVALILEVDLFLSLAVLPWTCFQNKSVIYIFFFNGSKIFVYRRQK